MDTEIELDDKLAGIDDTDDFGNPLVPEPAPEPEPEPAPETEVKEPEAEEVKEPVVPEPAKEPEPLPVKEPVVPVLPSVKPTISREDRLRSLGADDTIISRARQMSNEAFEDFTYQYERAQKLEAEVTKYKESGGSTLPPSYFDHPDGYTLSDEYKQATTIKQQIAAEAAHYKAQLNAIREGNDWKDLAYNPQTGQYSYVEKTADDKAEQTIHQYLARLSVAAEQVDSGISVKQKQFAEARQNRVNAFQQWEDSMFPDYKGKEETNENIKSVMAFLEKSQLGGNPMSRIVAKLYAFGKETHEDREALRARVTELEKNQKPATSNPTDDDINASAPSSKNAAEPTIADVEEEFEAYLNA